MFLLGMSVEAVYREEQNCASKSGDVHLQLGITDGPDCERAKEQTARGPIEFNRTPTQPRGNSEAIEEMPAYAKCLKDMVTKKRGTAENDFYCFLDGYARLENPEVDCNETEVSAVFLDEQLFHIEEFPWYTDIVHYLVYEQFPEEYSDHQRRRLKHECRSYFWDEPNLHFGGQRTVAKVLQSGFYWPTLFRDATDYVTSVTGANAQTNDQAEVSNLDQADTREGGKAFAKGLDNKA
ncbi:uncharacterized protein LOC120084596 [Benincasa hispida]|uniref:uncharacterized protein LOC120084596 n=1 Tax=Benincasa hispida TaxID=102211 RepID=UPI00190033A4|nr:uncharacterized protein LOC120084596 [Benincasa hispida]